MTPPKTISKFLLTLLLASALPSIHAFAAESSVPTFNKTQIDNVQGSGSSVSSPPPAFNPAKPITHKIQIQSITTQQSAAQGGATATGFGSSAQQQEIQSLLDQVWAQAGIGIEILPTHNYISSNTYNGHQDGQTYDPTAIRPADEFTSIFQDPNTPLSTTPHTLNLIFVDHMPGRTRTSTNSTSGTSFSDQNGIMLFVGENLLTYENGIAAIAKNLSRNIAHNLGLAASTEDGNLMQSLSSPQAGLKINQSQVDTIFTDTQGANDGFELLQPTNIPEPTTPILLAIGLLTFTLRRKK